MLSGSVSVEDKPLDDWNVVTPPLSLWSRPDWTSEHISIAEEQRHVKPNQNERRKKNKRREKRRVSNYLMEEKHDCYDDFSTVIMAKCPDISNILDDVPEGSDGTQPGGSKDTNIASDTTGTGTHFGDDGSDMELESPQVSPNVDPSLPYESGVGFQSGFESEYAQFGFGIPPPPPPYGNYGHFGYPYPTATSTAPVGPSCIYQGEQTDTWPPGAFPPDHRFG